MGEEYLDILDENGNKTGKVRTYNESHEKGFIHSAVHVWILNNKNEILIQKRSSNMRFYPGHWDVSASGHVSASETSLEAARKEVKEELGLDIEESKFKFLCRIYESFVSGKYINKEFNKIFVTKYDFDIDNMKLLKKRWRV